MHDLFGPFRVPLERQHREDGLADASEIHIRHGGLPVPSRNRYLDELANEESKSEEGPH